MLVRGLRKFDLVSA